jgi:hypothetical protein
MKPTKEQIDDAHIWFRQDGAASFARIRDNFPASAARIDVLLAGTEPDPGPPRPDDMGELARLVARELRRRGIWADARADYTESAWFVWVAQLTRLGTRVLGEMGWYSISASDFDNLTPKECADVIQREEARKASEWAGDS